MKIKLNGKEQIIDKGSLSITELLKIAKVETPEMVSVQRNGKFVPKEEFGQTYVQDSDEIDFMYFMGGG